ncbi:MAG: 3,4-dehydroadipyl-CoA semialdehyde dehydrogenase [Sphingomonadales bacterium]
MKLRSYLGGHWVQGAGDGTALIDPVSGAILATATTDAVDMAGAVAFARDVGGPNLRAHTYRERARMLSAIADLLKSNYGSYKETARRNSGNTSADADMDIGGAIFTLKYFARLGDKLGDVRHLADGEVETLSRDGDFQAIHIRAPRQGVAVHINAFNFPSWGMWEKAAVSLLSGAPTITKPATATALLAHDMVRDVVKAGVVPHGALSIVTGNVGNLLDHLTEQDVIAFTGSSGTARHLRTHRAVIDSGARLTVEADSINASMLGPDAGADSPEFELFVKEVVREMTFKAGQKCTAIRRAFVPAYVLFAVRDALAEKISAVAVGDPRNETVRMGPLVNKRQQNDVLSAIEELASEAEHVTGELAGFAPVDADPDIACFVPPTLLMCKTPGEARKAHDIEAFGPVCVLIPYASTQSAWDMIARGKGCLAASLFTGDMRFASDSVVALAPWNGRMMVVGEQIGRSHTGHGNVMPMCVHGGPGRAGGGEELGGLRGLDFYHQRTAIQGNAALISELANIPRSA